MAARADGELNVRTFALAVVLVLCGAVAPAQAATATLWRSEAVLMQKKLVAKVAARHRGSSRHLGACERVSRTAFDCSAELRQVERVGDDDIATVRRYRITVRRSSATTRGRITQTAYREQQR